MNYAKSENKTLIGSWSVVIGVILAAYLLEVLKGERTLAYYLTVAVLGLVPLLIAWAVYFKSRDSGAIKYISTIGYTVFYVFLLFTGDTVLTFTYVFPMLVVIMVYNNVQMIKLYAAVNGLANVAAGIIGIMNDSSPDSLAEREIQMAASVIVLIMACVVSNTLAKINRHKMNVIEGNKKEQEALLQEVLSLTDSVHAKMEKMYDDAATMEERAKVAAGSTEQISQGSMQTATSIQTQSEKTQEIQEIIENAVDLSGDINQSTEQSVKSINSGMENVRVLGESAVTVNRSTDSVQENMKELGEKAKEAEDIIGIINSIAKQTSLLALNASIEAARAGEAGRGFAIVAGEITELAEKTKGATENIQNIINDLKDDSRKASKAVDDMSAVSESQNRIITEVEANFKEIYENMHGVTRDVKTQERQMGRIKESNTEIIDSIFTISALSEETTANAENTNEISRENLITTSKVKSEIEGITNLFRDFEETYMKSK